MLTPSSTSRIEELALTANYIITQADASKLITNRTASSNILISFPNTLIAGQEFHVMNTSANGYAISFLPNPNLTFLPNTPQFLLKNGQSFRFLAVSSTKILVQPIHKGIDPVYTFQLAAKDASGAIESSTGKTWMWGRGDAGEMGNNTAILTNTSPITGISGQSFKTIKIGTNFAVAADATNNLPYSWGGNSSGQLGDGTTTSKSSPVAIIGGQSFVKFSSFYVFTCALSALGAAWAWGINSYGQLGDNSTTSRSSPVSVVGGNIFTQIAAGNGFTAAIDQNGQAWAWGKDAFGSLGDNSTTNTSSPVSVVGGKTFTQIAAGSYHSLALDQNGLAWAWGYNGSGQLGNNSTTDTSSPVSVLGGKTFIQVTAGSSHFLALEAGTGAIWAWGANGSGQLGNNSTTDTSSPVSVVGGKTFISVAGGSIYSMAIEAGTGVVWAWGHNGYGKLGDGTTTTQSSPVSIARLFAC